MTVNGGIRFSNVDYGLHFVLVNIFVLLKKAFLMFYVLNLSTQDLMYSLYFVFSELFKTKYK